MPTYSSPQDPLQLGRAWIVDDSPLAADLARRALADHFACVVFHDGHTMLEQLSRGTPPDLIVLDWQLPEMTGGEVCRFIRESSRYPGTPVLVLTSNTDSELVVEAFASGASDYVSKPFVPAELHARAVTLSHAQRTTSLLRVRAAIGAALASSAPVEAQLLACAQAVVDHLGGGLLRVWTMDAAEHPTLRASAGAPLHLAEGEADPTVKVARSIARAGARDASNELRRDRPEWTPWATPARFVAYAGFPLVVGGQVLGVLALFAERRLTDDTLATLASAVGEISVSLDRARAYEALTASESKLRALATAAQQSAQQLRFALDAARLGTFDLALASQTVVLDGRARELLGLAPGTAPLDLQAVWARLHPEDRPGAERAYLQALEGRGGDTFTWDYRVAVEDGQRARWIACTGEVHRDAGGKGTGVHGTFLDVTSRKEIETERDARLESERAARAEAEKHRDFERHLVGIVSHDLRSPLQTIGLATELILKRDQLDERVSKTVSRIQKSAERATRMIHDILDFTQARLGGGIRVQPQSIRLEEVVTNVLDELTAAEPGRDLRHTTEGQTSGFWDGSRLEQVVLNLVSNAIKYGDSLTPITVTTRGGETQVVLEVHNSGEPIPEDFLPHLFRPMHRAVDGSDQVTRSFGLGLYIVDHLVAAHRGTVEVESSRDLGTTFRVRLPRSEQVTTLN